MKFLMTFILMTKQNLQLEFLNVLNPCSYFVIHRKSDLKKVQSINCCIFIFKMAENRINFTCIWKIKNFSFSLYRTCFQSPFFVVDSPVGSAWSGWHWVLMLCMNENYVSCDLIRLKDLSPDLLVLNYELSFLAGDGSVIQSEKILSREFKKNYFDNLSYLRARRQDVFLLKKDIFIPDDTLTIRCRMWDGQKSTTPLGRCFAETRIGTEYRYVVGTIEKFSSVKASCKNFVCMKSSLKKTPISSINLYVVNDKLGIEIEPVASQDIYFKCNIFIQDLFGNKWKVGQDEFCDKSPKFIPLTYSKDYLLKKKDYFVPKDKLTIRCELLIPACQKNPEVEQTIDYEGIQGHPLSYTRNTDVSSDIENLTVLKDDLISLFRESILCDMKLKTDTETFPAHIAILSARSPVFKSMFTSNMKEKANSCVNIDDLDADTVRRMLSFMYSDTLEDLQYESAKSLYFAADKYNISSLRQRCSNFLKKNLLLSNCCDILLLADTHQDEYLKNAVQDYIAKNSEAVLISDEWKNLEKYHPQLTIEVFRFMHSKVYKH